MDSMFSTNRFSVDDALVKRLAKSYRPRTLTASRRCFALRWEKTKRYLRRAGDDRRD
jgi:hypothetical protein